MSFRSSLTVLFQAPFWVGIYERTDDEGYQACRVVFGPEPKDCEVYAFLLENWRNLSFSPPVEVEEREERHDNPKRVRREIRRQLEEERGSSTKAQQALSLQRERRGAEAKRQTREAREAEEERRYALRREKKRAKHRGR